MKRVIAVLLAAAIMLFAAGCGEQASPPQTPSSSAAESGGMDVTVVEVSGSAHVLHGDGTTGVLAPGSILGAGDSLITDRESTVELRLGGLDTLITVSPSSEIFLDRSLAADSGRELILVVRKGSVSNSVDVKLQAGDIYEVCTGDMTMAIRGTNALVDSRDGVTSVSLLTGTALVYNYFDGETYVVPSGVTGRFYSNDEPVFELIELGRYEEVSPAAKALLEKAAEDDKNFASASGYEKELRDDYCVPDSDYVFHVTEPYADEPAQQPEEQSAVEPVETTAAVETTTTPATTAATTAARTTAKKTTAASTVPTTPTVPTAPSEPTPSEPTAPTAPSEPIAPTAPSEPTAPTAPSEPTAPTAPSEPTAPTAPSEPTAPTTPSEPTAAKRYFYTLSGLSVNGEDIAMPMQSAEFTELPYTINATFSAGNGQSFSFSYTLTADNVDSYSVIPLILYADSATEGEYSASEVSSRLMVISY